MWIPPALLVAICVAVGLAPNLIAGPLLHAAANATVGGGLPAPDIHLWHGLNLPLLMSVIAIGVGALVWRFRWTLIRLHENTLVLPDGKGLFTRTVEGTVAIAGEFSRGVGNGSLQRYLGLLLGTVTLVVGIPLVSDGISAGSVPMQPITVPVVAGLVFLLVGVVGTVATHRQRLCNSILA